MRREEIIKAAITIREALQTSKVRLAIELLLKRAEGAQHQVPPGPGRGTILEAMRQYLIRAQTYTSAERELIQIFDLQMLEETRFWEFITFERLPSPEIVNILRKIGFAEEQLPKVCRMIQQEAIRSMGEYAGKPSTPYKGKARLSVIVIEGGARFSTPTRLSEVLVSVSLLYEACTIVEDASFEELGVIACDSGSDKSFDFLGAAKVIECVKDIILSVWDRVVFFRERKMENRIELVAKALPVIEKIGILEQEQKLSPEQAEILRRKITDGASKFISSGAIIPEMERNSSFNPRVLMAPEPKLLSAPLDLPPVTPDLQETKKKSTRRRKKTADTSAGEFPAK